ncbi:MAG: hypothetical protein L3J88_04750 [Gammaproteobacteria bacterium]|nr:hypothetical protein [Gammaproteobacteria bacterium]MCF6362649.1 hypothetical protein [Gammaproteobacteria bacterium]
MPLDRPDCLGDYDFERIAYFAKKRFIDGTSTVTLIAQAKTTRAKEEIALVSMLDIKDEDIHNIQLSCRYTDKCKIIDCRDRLRKMIKERFSDPVIIGFD